MEISANGDAPGANQMVEGPVIDPTTMIVINLMDFGEDLAGWVESLDYFDIVMMMFLMFLTLHILERICFIVFKCAKLILIGAAVTMGIMYACPEAKTSFWNFFGQRSNQ